MLCKHAFSKNCPLQVQEDGQQRRRKQRRGQSNGQQKKKEAKKRTISSFLSVLCFLLLLSIFLTRRRQFLSKALVYYCFLVFRHTGEYISLDLFYWDENFAMSMKKSAYPTPAGFTRAFIFCLHFCWSSKVPCAHTCWQDTAL